MTTTVHSYGPDCALQPLQPESNPFTRRASEVHDNAPTIRAHFFYSSALPIDDPLSPIPPPASTVNTGPSKVPPRPFSVQDNHALEEAWEGLNKGKATAIKQKDGEAKQESSSSASDHHKVQRALTSLGGPVPNQTTVENLTKIIKSAHDRRQAKLNIEQASPHRERHEGDQLDRSSGVNIATAMVDEHTHHHKPGDPHLTLCDHPDHIPFDHAMPVGSDEIGNEEFESGLPRKRSRGPFHRRDKSVKPKAIEATISTRSPTGRSQTSSEATFGGSPSERNTTGTPFLRVPERLKRSHSKSSRRKLGTSQTDGADSPDDDECAREPRLDDPAIIEPQAGASYRTLESAQTAQDDTSSPLQKGKTPSVLVPVGVSRLHMVEMPMLTMGPIYWDPIHDVSSVVRSTWFYKDSMLPVEPNVANQLEEGFEYIKPWTATYQDELKSCLEVGPEAELKITHRLWPPETSSDDWSRPGTSRSRLSIIKTETSKLNADERERKAAILVAAKPENRAAGLLSSQSVDADGRPAKLFARSSVIYANAREAQILKPSQTPSAARGRRPLAAIKKGRPVGVPVVRGFDYKAWEKLNPPSKRQQNAAKARVAAEAIRAATAGTGKRQSCGACLLDAERPRVTDLVLVIHGIGQKLSERVESFHFTHAINAFRRMMNVELEEEAVKPWLRGDLGSVMVLPINWRSTLQLDDGGPDPQPNKKDETSSRNQFTLKDITAESIPAVRNLISDVMLDIPYYLSHHKSKMVEAVVKEANRIYRLWVKNNPGFEDHGKVHIIAHSLGTVMALDILSNQPTKLPAQIDLNTPLRNDVFEFDTKNLFFCGSPAGFFMLLNKSPLLPRKGREKPDSNGDDLGRGIAGEAGTYGCLAVNNLYNISHYNDPIAYRLNACLDVDYAASLQPASVPSTTATWMQSFATVFRKPAATLNPADKNFSLRPSAVKMPSTVEMETHNFSKEEIAEKRMYLLNDNGQIDYTLHSGGGPLEIQYLNMLSAHSSYWVMRDFVRFLVVEIGRKEGREATLGIMRAVKRKKT